jgi:outer membrane assembly lipoprotein YfiO
MSVLRRGLAAAIALLLASACRPDFQIRRYPTSEALYEAALRELQARRWGNAVAGLEKLVADLSPRDTLLPRVHWHLGKAHQGREEWLLAAQSFGRLADGFPDDSLADDALIEAAHSYRRLWRKPELDSQYGEMALATYRQFLGIFPNSSLAAQATRGIAELEEWFARKNYLTGRWYVRHKAPDPAILYFRYIRENYPNSTSAREAGLRLVEVYNSIRWTEDAAQICAELRTQYANDREVTALCPVAANPPPQVAPTVPEARTESPVRPSP